MRKLALHWKILIGMALGLVFGLIASALSWQPFVTDFIKPIGTIFIKLLKLIAIPLILASLIKGVSDLQDISRFSKMGVRTLALYIGTTVLAISIGLIAVNIIQPGKAVSSETVESLSAAFGQDMEAKVSTANQAKDSGPLQFVVDMVPDNIFGAASNNGNMLQVIFFAVFFGIALLLIKKEDAQPVMAFINGLNEAIMKMVDLIMLMAPYAVFALLAALVTETSNPETLQSPGMVYVCCGHWSDLYAWGLCCFGILFREKVTFVFLQGNRSCPIVGF